MCVFKYHAFIFLIRPPRWQRETNTSLSLFSTSSKSQNQVKISNFLTILLITRKVITIEEWTKNLKNLVLSNEYAKKRITAQPFRENTKLTLLRLNSSKKSPQNPLWFLTTGFGIKRPIRIWVQIRQKLFAVVKNGDKKTEV